MWHDKANQLLNLNWIEMIWQTGCFFCNLNLRSFCSDFRLKSQFIPVNLPEVSSMKMCTDREACPFAATCWYYGQSLRILHCIFIIINVFLLNSYPFRRLLSEQKIEIPLISLKTISPIWTGRPSPLESHSPDSVPKCYPPFPALHIQIVSG